jgi:putative transposase
MLILLSAVFSTLCSMFRSRAALELEHIALRHQIGVLKRSARKRPKLTAADRLFWVFLSRVWGDWRSALDIVRPATAIAWHRKGFRLFWTWKIRHGRVGRPAVSREVRDLIRRMSRENPLWGSPHIHGELLKLGIEISETSVAKYVARHRKPPSQTWRTFLDNHVQNLVSVDFFTVPTIRFQVLYVFWCWDMTGAGWSSLMSPRIPRRNGRHSNCAKHFRLIKSRAICSAIAIRFSATPSESR